MKNKPSPTPPCFHWRFPLGARVENIAGMSRTRLTRIYQGCKTSWKSWTFGTDSGKPGKIMDFWILELGKEWTFLRLFGLLGRKDFHSDLCARSQNQNGFFLEICSSIRGKSWEEWKFVSYSVWVPCSVVGSEFLVSLQLSYIGQDCEQVPVHLAASHGQLIRRLDLSFNCLKYFIELNSCRFCILSGYYDRRWTSETSGQIAIFFFHSSHGSRHQNCGKNLAKTWGDKKTVKISHHSERRKNVSIVQWENSAGTKNRCRCCWECWMLCWFQYFVPFGIGKNSVWHLFSWKLKTLGN